MPEPDGPLHVAKRRPGGMGRAAAFAFAGLEAAAAGLLFWTSRGTRTRSHNLRVSPRGAFVGIAADGGRTQQEAASQAKGVHQSRNLEGFI